MTKIIIFLLLFSSCTFACSAPVFRYALMYWRSDPYQIILKYSQSETNKLAGILKEINKLNIRRSFILRKEKSTNAVGKIILKYPPDKRIRKIIWESELTVTNLKKILNSPFRKSYIDKIYNKKSLIFLLLEGENQKLNEKIAKIITNSIPKLEKEIKLPHEYTNIPKEDLKIYDTNIVFKLSFMRLSRTNSEEQIFINILTSSLPERIYKKDEPIVFPIFARGRMLAAFREKDVCYSELKRICEYVAGECSCEVKSRNPGFDIFIPEGWDKDKEKKIISETVIPSLTGFSEFLPVNEKKKK